MMMMMMMTTTKMCYLKFKKKPTRRVWIQCNKVNRSYVMKANEKTICATAVLDANVSMIYYCFFFCRKKEEEEELVEVHWQERKYIRSEEDELMDYLKFEIGQIRLRSHEINPLLYARK